MLCLLSIIVFSIYPTSHPDVTINISKAQLNVSAFRLPITNVVYMSMWVIFFFRKMIKINSTNHNDTVVREG